MSSNTCLGITQIRTPWYGHQGVRFFITSWLFKNSIIFWGKYSIRTHKGFNFVILKILHEPRQISTSRQKD